MRPHSRKSFDKWAKFYRAAKVQGFALAWPSETLVRLLRGDYLPGLPRDLSGLSVLDIGFGSGNNTIFLASTGLKVAGIEVEQDICEMLSQKLAMLGLEADLRVGTNLSIPFHDEAFDLLVSWDVLHYTDNEDDIRAGIAEYARVLRTGGRVLVSSTGPDHKILDGAVALGEHRHRIVNDELRHGQVFYYFDDEDNARRLFNESFAEVIVGRIHNRLFTATLDSYLVTGVKP